MARKLRRSSAAGLAATLVVAGPVMAACSSGPTYEEWAATDGAAGRINLDAVQDAFKESTSVTEFERRVNEIYEGDKIVLIRAEQDGDRLTLSGYEDLNSDTQIDGSADDLLFTIVRENDQNQINGHGANSYYHSSFGGGGFLFGFMLGSVLSPGRPDFYETSSGRARTIRDNRASYRNSDSYRSQVSRNSSYFSRQRRFHGSRYDQAARNLNPARQTYLSRQRQSGSFRNSSTGVRSSWGSRSSFSSRSSGGFRGFGGGQTIIGVERG